MMVLLLAGSFAIQAWAWRNLVRQLRGGTISVFQGVIRFAGWAFLPVLGFGVGFLVMVQIEERWDVAMIGERTSLLVIPLAGAAVLGTSGFLARCLLIR